MISTQNIFNAVEQDTAPTLDCQGVDVGTSADDHHAILIPGCILALSDRAARLGDRRSWTIVTLSALNIIRSVLPYHKMAAMWVC